MTLNAVTSTGVKLSLYIVKILVRLWLDISQDYPELTS